MLLNQSMALEYQIGDIADHRHEHCSDMHTSNALPNSSNPVTDMVDLNIPVRSCHEHDHEIINRMHQVLTRETSPDSSVTPTDCTDSSPSHRLMWSTSDGMMCLIWFSFESQIDPKGSICDFTESALTKSVSGDINACIYIGVHACSIPNIGLFKMDTIGGMPCIYVADAQNSRVVLNIVSQCMQQMWRRQCSMLGMTMRDASTAIDDQTSRDRHIVNAIVSDTADCCRSITNGFVNRRRWIRHLEQQLDQDETELLAFTKRFHALRLSSRWIDPDKMSTSVDITQYHNAPSNNRLVDKIADYHTQHKKWPKRSDVDISPSEARTAGGYKHLISLAHERVATV